MVVHDGQAVLPASIATEVLYLNIECRHTSTYHIAAIELLSSYFGEEVHNHREHLLVQDMREDDHTDAERLFACMDP